MRKNIIFLFVFLLLVSFVSAIAPVLQLGSSNGYTIETTSFQYVKAGQSFRAHFHVFNNSDGLRLNNVSVNCVLHLYYLNGTIMYDNDSIRFSDDTWNTQIDKSYFKEGKYYWFTHCNSSKYGGFIGAEYYVSKSGVEVNFAETFFYIALLIIIIVFLVMAIVGVVNNDGIEKVWLRYSFMSITYLLLIALTFIGWQMANSYINSSFIIEFLHFSWIILIYGFIPYIFLSFAYAFYQVLMIRQVMKWMSKGMSREEAEKRLKHGKK